MTTLIIPFGFDCNMGEIGEIEKKIEKSGIWTRANYCCPNVYRHIAALYNDKNSARTAALYTATNQAIQNIAKTREFCINPDRENYEYSYGDLQLYVFESGVGFLCMEVKFNNIDTLKKLRSVVANNVKHYRKTSGGVYGEELPMFEIIKSLLGFNKNDIFFSSANPNHFAQALTFSYICTSCTQSKTALYSLMHMVNEENYINERENIGEEHIIPFRGVQWGISSRSIVVVQDENSSKSFKEFRGDILNNYLPLIILAYHQKYAMIKFSAMVNGSPAQIKDARNDIIDFKVRSSFVSVSDTQVFQQLYDKIMSVNKIDSMIKENDRKLDSLLTRENNAHRAKLEKVTGVITLLFTIMGIVSILTDGMTAVNKFFAPDTDILTRIIMLAVTAILAAIGGYGIHIVRKHTK